MAVGRISGPLLKDNLLRNGVNLAFETNLLYLDVNNGRIGIKTSSPAYDLDVNGTTRTTNLTATTQANLATFTISGNNIASSSNTINFLPSGVGNTIYNARAIVGNLQLTGNTISATNSNGNINITANGTGGINLGNTSGSVLVTVTGNLHATGNITADGNITLGDNLTQDTVSFAAEINSDIIPSTNNTRNLGSDPTVGGNAWANAYIRNVISTNITSSTATINGINVVLPQGNIYYVATAGSDSNAGVHQNNPFLTIAKALSVATSGSTVYVYPGAYTEIFPLTIPLGVTLKGAGLRSVTIQPTVGTRYNDAILLNGETTVEDLTITGFLFNGGANTGYGFRFAVDFLVTTRSPYIRNVSVITRGGGITSSDPYGFDQKDAGKGVLADGSVAMASSKEASMMFSNVTFFTPNQETLSATNGVRIEWLNSFTYFADKGLYAYSSSAGFAGAGLTRLRINNKIGTWDVGNTVRYYDTDGITILASGVIASIVGNYVNLTGRCLGFETITDRIAHPIYTQGNAKLSTAQKKFGTASLLLDGVGDYVTRPSDPDFKFGTGAFTVEMWVYRTGGTGALQVLTDFRTSSSQVVPTLFLSATNYYPSLTVNATVVISGTTTVPLNTWTHIAVARSGTSTKIFMDGVQQGATYTDTNNYIQGPMTMGARFDGTTGFYGYVDDARISKGVARYTTTFTAPTAQLTGDLDSVVLLHFNGVDGSTIVVDEGVTLQDIRNITTGGSASVINFADYSDFGAEIRSIGSANVYGNYGAYGVGVGVIAYLVSQNFAYIGAGKLSTNDPNDSIAGNEVVENSGAKIYFTYVDNEGNFSVGDLFSVNQKTGEVTFNGVTTNIASTSGVIFSDGVNTTTLLPGEIDTGNIRISGNTVESITGPVNITAANGAINLQNNTYVTGNLGITGDFTVGGNIIIGDQTTDTINFVAGIASNLIPATTSTYDLGTSSLTWANSYFTSANLGNITIGGNTISTTTGDLNLQANGTSNVQIRNLAVNNNVISSININANIVLTPQGTGNVVINNNQSFIVPVGSTGQQPAAPSNGMIRYNTTNNRYEGYSNGYWTNLGGVQSVDGRTYIIPESTPGAGNNVISFYADNVNSAYINSSGLYTTDFKTANIDITGNTISTYTANTDINLVPNGTGSIVIGNLAFNNNTITNRVSQAVTVLAASGSGYYKFGGTYGVGIPFGNGNTDRPGNIYAETGMIRLNTDSLSVEVFNGAAWSSVVGNAGGITNVQATDIALGIVLSLG